MAKAKVAEKPAPKVAKNPELARISRDTEDAEVVRLNSEEKVLVFEGADFRPLPDEVVTVLSHENARRYWMAFGVYADRLKKPERPALEKIIDPLGGHEEARLTFSARGPEGKEFLKRNHLAWMFCTTVPGMKAKGYKEVHEEDPVEVGISSNASGYYLTKDTQGRDELLLMKVDKSKFDEHEKAVAALSRRAVRGAREKFEGELEQVSRGKVKPSPESDEEQSVEKVRVDRDSVNRAFLADKK